MDPHFSLAEEALRAEVRAFLDAELTEEMREQARLTVGVFAERPLARAWQEKLHRRGWAAPNWPREHGGPDWNPVQRYIFEKECAAAGAPILPFMGLKLLAPVLIHFGTPEQQRRFLPAILSGEDFWAQGFSEPGSGSDLASLRTRAVREGDHYRVNGSKTWTTHAHFANRIFCLVRTDPDVKPQRGISFLLMDVDLPGMSVRPILSASGEHEVNEVFFDDVLVPAENLVGGEGQGWTIAKFLLENERGGTFFGPGLSERASQLRGRLAEMPRCDPALAAALDKARLDALALELIELRIACDLRDGADPGVRALMTKQIAAETRQALDRIAMDLHGPDGLQMPWERPLYDAAVPPPIGSDEAQAAAARYLNSRAWTIFGGTTEIQLSILARSAFGF
jgi:alkylation response protein AidB-like acyl-CoA dehydrogenase